MPHDHPTDSLNGALHTLREHGQRVTGARKAVLGLLLAEHGPYSAEEIHAHLPVGECDLVTVYRTVTSLEELGVLRRCDFGDGVYRYEFNHADHHHHHIVCRECRSVQVLDGCVADVLEKMARDLGYAHVSHTLEIFGICPACQRAAAAN